MSLQWNTNRNLQTPYMYTQRCNDLE